MDLRCPPNSLICLSDFLFGGKESPKESEGDLRVAPDSRRKMPCSE